MSYSMQERVEVMVRALTEVCSRMQAKLKEEDGNRSRPGPFILHRNQWNEVVQICSKVLRDINTELLTILGPLQELESVMKATEKSLEESVAPHVRGKFTSTDRHMDVDCDYVWMSPGLGDVDEQRKRSDLRLWMAKHALRHILDREAPHRHLDNLRIASMAVQHALLHVHPNTLVETLRHVHPDTLTSRGSAGISIRDFSDDIYARDKEQARAFFSHAEMAKIDISELLLHRLRHHLCDKNVAAQFQKCECGSGDLWEGAFSKVESREWICEDHHVAVKKGYLGRQEIKIQARLRHRNVLPLLCWTRESEDSEESLLVMERMDRKLDELIDAPLGTRLSVEIMLQIAKGMEHLHNRDIMHRDLKPANILVSGYSAWTPDDPLQWLLQPQLRVKVADFGASKIMSFQTSDRSNSYRVGSGFYRAPEVMDEESDEGYGMKADIYSFAMVRYRILSGKEPFEVDPRPSYVLRHEIRKANLRPEFDFEFECEDALKEMVDACWQHDASERPDFEKIADLLRFMKICILRRTTHFAEGLFRCFHDLGLPRRTLDKQITMNIPPSISIWRHSLQQVLPFATPVRTPPFPLPVSVEIMLQIAKGMDCLHRHNIIHGDLNPANILVFYRSAWPSNAQLQLHLLRVKIGPNSSRVGNGLYRAREVGEEGFNSKYTKKADVYSFAVVCYRILSGKEPFHGDANLNRPSAVVPPEFHFECADALRRIVEACWHQDASRRPDFAQIADLLRSIKICLDSERLETITSIDDMFSGSTQKIRTKRLTIDHIFTEIRRLTIA